MLKSEAIRRQELMDRLAQVQALLQAVASAISAIEKNDLRQFEIQLAMQETMCHRLSANQWTPTSTVADSANAKLEQEIRQAHIALAQLNRVYAALLKRARKSAELMAALYRSHGAGYDPGSHRLPQHHTWSC